MNRQSLDLTGIGNGGKDLEGVAVRSGFKLHRGNRPVQQGGGHGKTPSFGVLRRRSAVRVVGHAQERLLACEVVVIELIRQEMKQRVVRPNGRHDEFACEQITKLVGVKQPAILFATPCAE